MLTRQTIKIIKELHEKKYRNEYGLFLVEGEKSVTEVLKSNFEIQSLFITAEFFETYKEHIKKNGCEYTVVEQQEIENMSALESNTVALAIVKQKIHAPFSIDTKEIILALDTIRDPGNLGTIIRIADWYGITKIVASPTTTDQYNPKTIAASMGSFTRVTIAYTDLEAFLKNTTLPTIGAFLEGKNIHSFSFPQEGVLVIGNESHGINRACEKVIKQKITIPSFGNAESLNASVATAVILDNWRRSIT